MYRTGPLPAAVMASVAGGARGYERATAGSFASRSEIIAANAMAATSQPLATQIALDLLKVGGSAVDAAIAANAALGVMEPTGCGIGGDLFALVWDAGNAELTGLNASGRSPGSLTADEFKSAGFAKVPEFGPLSVSVPGAVDGWFQLHDRYGRLPMAEVLAPAIRYAREGFPVSEVIARHWALNAQVLGGYPGFGETYLPDGRAPRKGDVFRNPRLATSYEKLVTGGREAFYEGEISETISAYMAAQGGHLSASDLAAHRSEWVEPACCNYRGYDVYELPPNSQGIAVLQMLNVLEGFDVAGMGFGSPEYVHHVVEAKKLAYEDRARFYADPGFCDVPVVQLISRSYARTRRRLIDAGKAAATCPAGDPLPEHGDTVYLTTADRDGNMVSLIQSNYAGMGSGMTPTGLGFVLQNRGALFSLEPRHPNAFAPGKRPFHTIIPAFVMKDGTPWLSFGVMGGSMQPQGHVQILANMIDFGMNLQEAGDAARFRHTGSSQPTGELMSDGGLLYLESGYRPELRASLEKMGHRLATAATDYGGYQAILRNEEQGVWYGASESRKDGQAAGY